MREIYKDSFENPSPLVDPVAEKAWIRATINLVEKVYGIPESLLHVTCTVEPISDFRCLITLRAYWQGEPATVKFLYKHSNPRRLPVLPLPSRLAILKHSQLKGDAGFFYAPYVPTMFK